MDIEKLAKLLCVLQMSWRKRETADPDTLWRQLTPNVHDVFRDRARWIAEKMTADKPA